MIAKYVLIVLSIILMLFLGMAILDYLLIWKYHINEGSSNEIIYTVDILKKEVKRLIFIFSACILYSMITLGFVAYYFKKIN